MDGIIRSWAHNITKDTTKPSFSQPREADSSVAHHESEKTKKNECYSSMSSAQRKARVLEDHPKKQRTQQAKPRNLHVPSPTSLNPHKPRVQIHDTSTHHCNQTTDIPHLTPQIPEPGPSHLVPLSLCLHYIRYPFPPIPFIPAIGSPPSYLTQLQSLLNPQTPHSSDSTFSHTKAKKKCVGLG